MEGYIRTMQRGLKRCYEVAGRARSLGMDPVPRVEIPTADRLSERVEKLLDVSGVADIIDRHLERVGREEAAIAIAKDTARLYDDPSMAMDRAVRIGLAVLTEGILVAPTGGIAEISVRPSGEGEYVSIMYAGPIRSAGGTAQAMSVLIADVVRRELGIGRFTYTRNEIERFKEEIPFYKSLRNLQYLPGPNEIEMILRNMPVCVDGEGTEQEEISGYRDIPRIATNRVRGGACLVIADGIAHKAAKILKHANRLNIEGWEFLRDLLRRRRSTARGEGGAKSDAYLRDMVAGRPVFSEPGAPGGFRLRYGRSRATGLAAMGVHPATMLITRFIAVGTQLKMERPGKGAAVTPCDTIEGPTVLLDNGDLVRVSTLSEAEDILPRVEEVVELGDILISHGEFVENNERLLPGAYCEEWWRQEWRGAGREPPIIRDSRGAVRAARSGVPLHPRYTYAWHDAGPGRILALRGTILKDGSMRGETLHLPKDAECKRTLVDLCIPHRERDDIEIDDPYALLASLGIRYGRKKGLTEARPVPEGHVGSMELVNALAGFTIRRKAPTRVGTRMGRPEKARERMLEKKKINVLFPMGHGSRRRLSEVMRKGGGRIRCDLMAYRCSRCESIGISPRCSYCEQRSVPIGVQRGVDVDIKGLVDTIRSRLGADETSRLLEKVMGVKGLLSKDKVAEPLEKGFLRARHDVYLYKDGTSRFDLTDVPLTHFRPREIGISVETARSLGYEKDHLGRELTSGDQLVELHPQDVIPSRSCMEYMARVAGFVDDLLREVYGLKAFYGVKGPEDLIGHLAIGLAPHTSCGVLVRIIGFTDARVCYAHPYFHAAKRRNCDGDEDSLILLMDALLNFSRGYLPEGRGSTMDSPMVLATGIDPSQIDKEAHNIDTMSEYPLEFYQAAERGEHPRSIERLMMSVSRRLAAEEGCTGIMFTHDITDLSDAPTEGSYTLCRGDMRALLDAEVDIMRRLRGVNVGRAVSILLEHHFLSDMQGCLRKFHTQSFQCTKCRRSVRRMPLSAVCPRCGGPLRLTVTRGSVTKYLPDAKRLLGEFDIDPYVVQRVAMMETFFGTTFTDAVRSLDDFGRD